MLGSVWNLLRRISTQILGVKGLGYCVRQGLCFGVRQGSFYGSPSNAVIVKTDRH